MKKVLKSLKVDKITNVTEIKHVRRCLTIKLKKQEQSDAFNHDDQHIKENYWKYCKNPFEINETVLPTFSENDCWKRFRKTCHEPKHVRRCLTIKLKKQEQSDAFNHDDQHIKENYWKYCKNPFEINETVLPTFSENDCWKRFRKTCHEPKPSKVFNMPSWMKQPEEPILTSNLQHVME